MNTFTREEIAQSNDDSDAMNSYNESVGDGLEAVVNRMVGCAIVALACAAAIQLGWVFW